MSNDKRRCHYCSANMGSKRTTDHIVPVSRGGEDSGWNKVFACRSCNGLKADGWPTHECHVCRNSIIKHARMGTTEEGPRDGWVAVAVKRSKKNRRVDHE